MRDRSNIVIIGDGEFARVAYEYFTHASPYEVNGFCVERRFHKNAALLNLPVGEVEEIETAYPATDYTLFVAITYTNLNRTRERIFKQLKAKGYQFVTYVHPAAAVADSARIGENSFIYDGCSIQPFAQIADNVICGSGTLIAHRACIAANAYLASGSVIGGFSQVGNNSFLGLNCTIADKLHVCAEAFISAGAVLLNDAKQPHVYQGNPAQDTGLSSRDLFRLKGGTL